MPGNPGEKQFLPQTVNELQTSSYRPRKVTLEGRFARGPGPL